MMGSTSVYTGAILTLGLLLSVGEAARADEETTMTWIEDRERMLGPAR